MGPAEDGGGANGGRCLVRFLAALDAVSALCELSDGNIATASGIDVEHWCLLVCFVFRGVSGCRRQCSYI